MSAVSTPTPAERVQKGAAWLDTVDPGWEQHINLEDLDIEDCQRCILGQRFGSYVRAIQEHGPSGFAPYYWSREHGFNANNPIDAIRIEGEWAELIYARRGAES